MTWPSNYDRDTQWTAADGAGHLALFEAGTKGAIPATDPPLQSVRDTDLLLRLGPLLEKGTIPIQIDDLLAEPPGPPEVLRPSPSIALLGELTLSREEVASGLLLLRHGVPVSPLGLKRAVVVPVPEGQLVLLGFGSGLTWGEYQKLEQQGAVLRAWGRLERGLTHFPEPWRIGLFHYVHDNDDLPAPYVRGPIPPQPLTLDRLPDDFRASLASVRFVSVRFADTPLLQPLEHFPHCHTRGAAEWLAGDGKTIRPI